MEAMWMTAMMTIRPTPPNMGERTLSGSSLFMVSPFFIDTRQPIQWNELIGAYKLLPAFK